MDELISIIFRPLLDLLLVTLRTLQFLAWDLCFSTIGWSIGWCFYRLISFGRFPTEDLRDLDNCSLALALFIEITGLIILGIIIFLIANIL